MGGWDRTRWSYAIVGLAAAGLAGWVGHRNEVAVVTPGGKAPLTFRSAARQLLAPKAERDAMKQLAALRQRAGRGPLKPSEAAECWQIIRGFSEDQVKACLTDIPGDSWYPADGVLAGMLFQRWAQLAPETAAQEAMKPPHGRTRGMMDQILATWLARDQEGAARWVAAAENASLRDTCGRMLGTMLVRQDPSTALAKAEALGPETMAWALGEMARGMAATAESRKAFLALREKHGGQMEWQRAIYSLTSAMAEQDPDEVLASLHDTGLTPERQNGYRNAVFRMVGEQHPRKALEWAADPASGVPKGNRFSTYMNWMQDHPKEAAAWAAESGSHDLIEFNVRMDVEAMVRYRRATGTGSAWTADMAERLRMWQAHDPAASGKWMKALPPDIRNQLNGRTADAAGK